MARRQAIAIIYMYVSDCTGPMIGTTMHCAPSDVLLVTSRGLHIWGDTRPFWTSIHSERSVSEKRIDMPFFATKVLLQPRRDARRAGVDD
jgi:hypothetical protein